MTNHVFISYAHKDAAEFSHSLADDLSNAGFQVWIDKRKIQGGRDWELTIEEAIQTSTQVLAILSPASVNSPVCRAEIGYAINSNKPVIPIMHKETVPPLRLTNLHYLNFTSPKIHDREFNELLKILQGGGQNYPQEHASYHVDRPNTTPPLPINYIKRNEKIDELRQFVISEIAEQGFPLVALQGMGGIGKSVLAKAIGHDAIVQEAFPDGVLWVKIGRDPGDMTSKIGAIGKAIDKDTSHYNSLDAALSRLRNLLTTKSVLIILDDVWDKQIVEQFYFNSPQSQVLFTTRDKSIPLSLGAEIIEVGVLPQEDSIRLLEIWSETSVPDLKEIAVRLGNHPLALKLAGARLREGMSASKWLEMFDNVANMSVGQRGNDPTENLKLCFDLSVDQLPDEEKTLYYTLGIFPEDAWIPEHVVNEFWQSCDSSVTEFQCAELISYLNRLALIDITSDRNSIILHDLLHDYTKINIKGRYEGFQKKLLASINPENVPWYLLSRDSKNEYLFEYLIYHLSEAGLQDQVIELISLSKDWLEEIPPELRDKRLKKILLDGWTLHAEMDFSLAQEDLMKWLKKKSLAYTPNSTGFYPKAFAVQCSFHINDAESLSYALIQEESFVQDTAVRFLFYLNEYNPQKATDIIELASTDILKFGLPNVSVLRVLLPLIVLLVIENYRRKSVHPEAQEKLISVLQKIIKRITYVGRDTGLRKTIASNARSLIVEVLKNRARALLSEGLDEVQNNPERIRGSVNSIEEFAQFFELSVEEKNRVFFLLPYLNRSHGTLREIKDEVYAIFESENQLSITLANFIIMVRSLNAIDDVVDIYEFVFDSIKENHSDNNNLIAQSSTSIAHALYSAFDRHQEIPQNWLTFLKEAVRCHIDNCPHGYGVTHTAIGMYIYHSMMYYGSIWSKVYPDQSIDLIDEYLLQAEGSDDSALLIYLIDSIGERATTPENYLGVLESFIPYLKTEDEQTRKALITSLAIIRNKKTDQVDEFLNIHAPSSLHNEITINSFNEPITELGRRLHEFIVDFLLYADLDIIDQIVSSATLALTAPTLDIALEIIIKELLNKLTGEKVFSN